MVALGVIAVIIGYATVGIEVGSFAVGLAFFVIGSARIWRATITDKSIWGTI